MTDADIPRGVHELARFLMDKAIEQDDWDEIPMLVVMLGEGDDQENILCGLAEGHPVDMINAMADSTLTGSPIWSSKIPRGVLLQNEGWGLMDMSPEEILAVQMGDRIEDMPDRRIEARMVTSWDGETMVTLMQRRGETEATATPHRIEGRVSDSLKHLFDALLQTATPSTKETSHD